MENLLWGAVLRFAQALLQATPTILIGLVVAGVFRRLLGHAGTRRLFGDNSWRSLPQAWLVGMLLPVCSLGIIPVVREMRRAGVSGGAILAFGLTAPLFNPISVLYGLTLADPIVILTFSFCSFVIVTVLGIGWDKLFPGTASAEPEPPAVAMGAKRMLSIAVFGARELAGASSLYILAGLVGVAILSLILPAGYLQTAAEQNDPWAPLFMTSVAIPAYATPMTAMVQLASMFQHGNSVGAAFALLALGAGANVGLVVWMIRAYGVGRSVAWFALLIVVVVGLAYGVDKPLRPSGVEPAGHTHAFDIYCAPFRPDTNNPFTIAWNTLRDNVAPHEIVGMLVAGVFLLAGLAMARWDREGRIEKWLEQQPKNEPRLDFVLPGPVLGGVALVGLITLSVVGCYVYYPPPDEIFEEMRIVNTEVVASATSQDWDTGLYWIPIYDDWTRKLQVSMFLRGEQLTPYRRAKANVLRDKLELLKHEIEDKEVEESRQLGLAVGTAYRRMQAAYVVADSHRHEAGNDHDHRHSHDHDHRQVKPRLGGKVVEIGHSHHATGETYYHAEIMPILNGKITFHVLKETRNGESEEASIEESEIIAYVDWSDQEQGASVAEVAFTKTDGQTATFEAVVPDSFLETKELAIIVPRIKLGGQRLNFSFTASHTDDAPPGEEFRVEPTP